MRLDSVRKWFSAQTSEVEATETKQYFALPNFFIIGANKAGTTSLAYYLSQHPQFFISSIKEPMFFTSQAPARIGKKRADLKTPYWTFTLEEYSRLFGTATEPWIGEASTAYLANPSCAAWIKKLIPNAKIVAVLRNPVERAFSAYRMYHGQGIEKRSFDAAVLDEVEKGVNGVPQGQHYLTLGLYGRQVSMFMQHFPLTDFFVGNYDDYTENAESFLAKLFDFFGADHIFPHDKKKLNVSGSHYGMRKAPEMHLSARARNALRDFYEADIEMLSQCVDYDVARWVQL